MYKFLLILVSTTVIYTELLITKSTAQNANFSEVVTLPWSYKHSVNTWTNSLFYALHPYMRNQKIQSYQTLYQKEWLAINRVIKNNTKLVCNFSGSEGYYDFVGYIQDVADAVFYARHPELNGRKIRAGEYELAREWRSIYQAFEIYQIPRECLF